DPPRAPLQSADALAEPPGQCAFRLVAQPEPGKLDHGCACSRVAGSADAPVTVHPTALIGHRCDADIAGELTAVAERAVEHLEDQHGGEVFADTADPLQSDDLADRHVSRFGLFQGF